jgi:hypothetical protein
MNSFEDAKIIPLSRGYMRGLAKPAASLFDVYYRTRVVGVRLTFQIPESVVRDFESFVRRQLKSRDSSGWRDVPIAVSLGIGIPEKGEWGWDFPINRPLNGLSRKGLIKQIKALSKQEPVIAITEEIGESFWIRIQERAAFYGISAEELCLSCIGYHANIERRSREKIAKSSSRNPALEMSEKGGRA